MNVKKLPRNVKNNKNSIQIVTKLNRIKILEKSKYRKGKKKLVYRVKRLKSNYFY